MGAAVALASSGGLDPTFGNGGTALLDREVSTLPTPAAVLPGGRILVLTSSNDRFTVSRLLSDGAPDPTFDGDGQAAVQTASTSRAFALAMQPDGKIVVAGLVSNGPGSDLAVWRLKPDGGDGSLNGALDPAFDTDGVATFDSSDADRATAVAVAPDGKIVAAGQTFNPTHIGVWRFTAGGAHDNSFDTDGAAGIGTDSDYVNAMTLQPDGKILLAGQTGTPATDAGVWRLKPNGGDGVLDHALDTTFDTDGRANIDSGGDERALSIALQPDNRILVAGDTTSAPNGSAAAVYRLTPAGSLDSTFDTDGAAAVDSGGFADGTAVGVQPDGKILLAGTTKIGADPFVAALWRLTPGGGTGDINGALDATFGSAGVATVASGSGAAALSLAQQPDRRIVVAGATFGGNLLVFRVLGDPFGLIVTTAGTGAGTVQSSPSGIACAPTCSGTFDDGASVTLTATAASGSVFAGWSGAGCSGTGTCTVTMGADQSVTATFNANQGPPGKHFVLKARQLSMKAFRRNARRARASITGLPAATAISGSLLAGRRTLARKKAKAGAGGRARLTFTFTKKARKRLRSKKLKTVTLKVTAKPPGDTASKASRKVRLKRAR